MVVKTDNIVLNERGTQLFVPKQKPQKAVRAYSSPSMLRNIQSHRLYLYNENKIQNAGRPLFFQK